MNAALAISTINKITLSASIEGDFYVAHPLEINLNGHNITGALNYIYNLPGESRLVSENNVATVSTVKVGTPYASFVQGENVTVTTLNLENVKPGTYTNNGKITTANITDTDARFLNEGSATVDTLNINTAGFVTLGGSSKLDNVIVTKAKSVNIESGTIITKLEVNSATTVNNAGTITELAGAGVVTLTGIGDVTKATNPEVTVPKVTPAKQSLLNLKDLVESAGVYSTSFDWSSTTGVGTKLVEKPDRYNYFNNGAYLDITVKGATGGNVAFETLFDDMTLVTDGGNVDSIKGTDGRQAEDWAGTDGEWKTKLKADESKAVFYGVRQTGTGTTVGDTRTVGFNAGESRKIDLTLTPKANIAPGTYTVTIQPKQQTGVTSGENLGQAITYEFTVPSIFDVALNHKYKDFTYTGTSKLTKTSGSSYELASTYANVVELLKGAAMDDMARYLGALNYVNGPKTPTKIIYNGSEYTWDPAAAGNLKGSNWYSSSKGKTLVKVIEEEITALITIPEDYTAANVALNSGLVLQVDGQELILKSKITGQ